MPERFKTQVYVVHPTRKGRISDLRYHLTMSLHSRVHVRKGTPEKTSPENMPPENMPPEKTPSENMPPEKTPSENMPPEGADMNSPR